MDEFTSTVAARLTGEPKPPLPGVFSGNLLSDETLPEFDDNTAVSRYLMDRSLLDLGGRPITGPSEDGDALLAEMMASETIYALNRDGGRDSSSWYTKAIERMIAVVSILHPEIGDDGAAAAHPSGLFRNRDEARTVIFAAMAITSQNINVLDNMRYALEQYRMFIEDGAFRAKPYGANGAAIESNLERFNFILSRANGDLTRVRKLLSMKMRMGDLQAAAARFGIRIGGKELADETVYGSMLFGPKVGNGFFQNLTGNHSPVTIDLWFMRLWGRYTGTLVRDEVTGEAQSRLVKGVRRSMAGKRMRALMEKEGVAIDPATIWDMDAQELLDYSRKMKRFWEKLRKRYVTGVISDGFHVRDRRKAAGHAKENSDASELKAKLVWPGAAESIVKSLGMPVDSPRSGGLRRWIRSVCAKSLDRLKDSGYTMTAADMQAILWYPEKEIYGKLAGRPSERLNMSYDEAVIRIAIKEGAGHAQIEEALQSVAADRDGGPAGAGSAERGERQPDGGLRGRTPPDVGPGPERGFLVQLTDNESFDRSPGQ